MTDTSINTLNIRKTSFSQCLFNPFKFIAGFEALLLGLALIIIAALAGWLGNTHFDGVLDVHIGLEAPIWFFIAEGIINWLSLTLPLIFFGLIISNSSFRLVDVFGTQALARAPYLLSAVVALPEANRRFAASVMSQLQIGTFPLKINYADAAVCVFAGLIIILMAVWMVALMYRAYTVSCNIKGAKAIITFIIAIIGAEALSKLAIYRLATL